MGCTGGTPPNMQLLYEAALCIWQLTFLPEAAEKIGEKTANPSSSVVAHLVDIARTAQKEKVPPLMSYLPWLLFVTINVEDQSNLGRIGGNRQFYSGK